MFAARFLSSTPFVARNNIREKSHCRTTAGMTTTSLLCCLLLSLPTLTMAEETTTGVAPTIKDATPAPALNSAQKDDSGEQLKGRVARAIFTSAIVDREPVDDLSSVSGDTQRVYFFTDLRELAGQIVTHRWEYNGKVMAEVTFKVGNGTRWRVYSSKNLLPEWTGQWKVVVSNENGSPLKTSTFEYSAGMSEIPTTSSP